MHGSSKGDGEEWIDVRDKLEVNLMKCILEAMGNEGRRGFHRFLVGPTAEWWCHSQDKAGL